MVPRTGGGYTDGTIIDIHDDMARTSFPVGETFRGRPVNSKDKGRTAYKTVALKELLTEEQYLINAKVMLLNEED